MSISRKRTNAALLVVGMQNDKVTMMDKQLEMAITSAFIKKVNKSIDLARDKGWMIIYVMDLHHRNHCSFTRQEKHCMLGSWGSQQVSELHYALPKTEQVVRGVDIDGDSNDAYYITDRGYSECAKESRLREIVNSNHLSPLYISGLSPEGCIEQTCFTAARFGHETVVISDCTMLLLPIQSKTCTLDDLLLHEK